MHISIVKDAAMLRITKNIIASFFVIILFSSPTLYSFFPINLFRPYDINLRPPIWCGENFQWTSWAEIGYKARGFNAHGQQVSSTNLWTSKQNALAMLKGFDSSSSITEFYIKDLGSPEDNGLRGTFHVDGDFKASGFGLAGRYHFPYDITFGIYLPVYDMILKNVKFIDQTSDTTTDDSTVKTELTSQLMQRVKAFDSDLNLTGWHQLGLGDAVFMGEWYRCFPQGKPVLKNVSLDARFGLQVPTGVKNNINEIAFVPFGLDGAFGLIFGGGIDLTWFDVFRGGVDIEFVYQFGNTRYRRFKVDQDQTEFLLLAKSMVHKDFGFTHRFNIYVEGNRIYRGLSTSLTYQFWKHGDDKLSICTNIFSDDIANTAQSLKEWTMHNLIFKVGYDFQDDVQSESSFKPQVSFFYKFPFNGKRAILCNTAGVIFTLNF
jgi:hypothetical protein